MHIHAYVALCLYAGFLAIVRVFLSDGDTVLGWLVWNLILAVIPYFFAMMAAKEKWVIHWIFFFLWLFFFPNSLYIFTDFIHLGYPVELIHYDIVLIASTAFAGLIAGFASLEILHTYWNRKYHHIKWWIFVSAIMMLSLLGVYIGRFLRFNSWDILREPMNLIREIITLLVSPNTLPAIARADRAQESLIFGANPVNVYVFTLLYFWFFMILYVFLYHTRKVR